MDAGNARINFEQKMPEDNSKNKHVLGNNSSKSRDVYCNYKQHMI
jgi:hypothetical protein